MPRQPSKYFEIAEILTRESQILGTNSLLPSETLLAKRFGVNRLTVRRALGLLQRAGLVSRDRGRGTVVNPPKITRRLGPFYRLEEDLLGQGVKFETQVIKYERRSDPPDWILKRLNLTAGTSVGFLLLARLVDDRVVTCDFRYFPPAIAERFEPSFIAERPVYEILTELGGVPIAAVEWETEILPSPYEVASILRITPGVLVLANSFADLLEDGSAIEAGVMYFRIDRWKFKTIAPWSSRMSS